jgi:regulatory protein
LNAEGKPRTRTPRVAAMDLLARREHSASELRLKLIARDFDASEVDQAVSKLVEEGLISDQRFAEAFVTSRVRKGQGPSRIRQELERRGVSSGVIFTHLEHSGVDWNSLAKSVRDKKFGDTPVNDYGDWARQATFLQYRGFTSEQIGTALGDQEE